MQMGRAIHLKMRSGRAHVSATGSVALGVPVGEGSQESVTGSVKVHGTVKVDTSGGDGGVVQGFGSAGAQAEYEERGCR